eukprot:EG_transcript_4015
MAGHQRLAEALGAVAIVDHHCHNLAPSALHPCFTEAQGPAAAFASSSLGVRRALKDAAELLGCEATEAAVEARRQELGPEAVAERCFGAANIAALLLDDGFRIPNMLPTPQHERYVGSVRRVLRIEAVAEELLGQPAPGGGPWELETFETAFVAQLSEPTTEVPVVAFKSVCCYRSGLEVSPTPSRNGAREGLQATLQVNPRRVAHKGLVDFLVVTALRVAMQRGLPLQLHTGFGDTDLDLRLANPLHLRSLLEHPDFRPCRLVLLHAAYPFCREAGFLATVYPQVYLDFGLAVPHLSVQGMREAVRQCLHLCPTEKLLYSSDAHSAPEAYYCAAKWGRRVLALELAAACDDGDLTEAEAIAVGTAVLQGNALRLYPDLPAPPPVALPATSSSPPLLPPAVRFVHLLWCDAVGLRRTRVVPAARYPRVLEEGVGLTKACMAVSLLGDVCAPGSGLGPCGEVRLVPDSATLRTCPWDASHAVVLGHLREGPGQPWACDPRAALQRALAAAEQRHGLTFRVGFESEFSLLRQGTMEPVDGTPYCSSQAWHRSAAVLDRIVEAVQALGLEVEQGHAESAPGQFEVVTAHLPAMAAVDALLLTREAISATAWRHGARATFIPKWNPSQAGNGSHLHLSLWRAGRNVTGSAGAADAGPCGLSQLAEAFVAGLLQQLPALLAVTAPSCNSHRRLQPGTWSGAYQCWGLNNREAPLRVVVAPGASAASNLEYKALDATANPHLALAAIIHAGLWGVDQGLRLPPPVAVDPAAAAGVPRLPG